LTSFRILGPVEAAAGERRLAVGGPMQVKLLAYLLLHANRAVSTDALADAMWGPARSGADNRLQMAIVRLRKALGPLSRDGQPLVRTVGGGYLLSVAPGELDADVFADAVERGRQTLDAQEPARAVELLSEALALWRGPPLAEVAFEDFARAVIRGLEELRLVALETRLEAELQLGRHAQLVAGLERLVAEYPTRERLAAQLMVTLYRCGRQTEALQVYQRTRVHLGQELGLDPGPALKELQARILNQDRSLAPPRVAVRAARSDRSSERTDTVGHRRLYVVDHVRPEPRAAAAQEREELVERSAEIEILRKQLTTVSERANGRVILVRGEAGIGKTALLRRFCDELEASVRVLWAACDPLFTPQPLGPLLDIARTTGGEPLDLVESGARPHEIAAAMIHELESTIPTVLVLEDLHWADEATLDVLRLISRRVQLVPALLIVSYRDDELDRSHPLRIVVGELPSGGLTTRLELAGLSRAAVARLAANSATDADELYQRTGGNPFFVTEALAAGSERVPSTVRDAVLARAARLAPVARAMLDAAAVIPQRVELWLLEALLEGALGTLDQCLASGMLRAHPDGVEFRHELARVAVEESLAPDWRLVLHRRALGALVDPAVGMPVPARLAYHAEAAGDRAAVLRFAPAAAEQAASVGAHREAAGQYARALRFAPVLAPELRADLLERFSHECFLTDMRQEALQALDEELGIRRDAGDVVKQGDAHRRRAALLACAGRHREARGAAVEAVTLLEQAPPGRELARAYSELAALHMRAAEAEEAIRWGQRASALAEQVGDTEALVRSLTGVGTVEFGRNPPEGRSKIERALELAKQAGLPTDAGRAYINLIDELGRRHDWALADRYIGAGTHYCREHGLEAWLRYMHSARAESELAQGRWSDAAETAQSILAAPPDQVIAPRYVALMVLALVRPRRRERDYWPLLDEALEISREVGELQYLAPVAVARAEAAWLEGRPGATAGETDDVFALALRLREPTFIAELACWRWRAGILADAPADAADPCGLQIAGQYEAVAQFWREHACPYEAALALADAPEEVALRQAYNELRALGSQSAAAIVERRLCDCAPAAAPSVDGHRKWR